MTQSSHSWLVLLTEVCGLGTGQCLTVSWVESTSVVACQGYDACLRKALGLHCEVVVRLRLGDVIVSARRVTRVYMQVDEVKNIMVDNIEKVLERGERIELLVDKTENLRSQVCASCLHSAQ